jgi:hypothetical protein
MSTSGLAVVDSDSDSDLDSLREPFDARATQKAARQLFRSLGDDSRALAENLDKAYALFEGLGRTDFFMDGLLSPASYKFLSLPFVDRVGVLAKSVGRYDDFVAWASAIAASAPSVRFTPLEYLHEVNRTGDREIRKALLHVKYAGLDRPSDPQLLFSNASQMAKRMHTEGHAFNYLFSKRRATSLSWTQWEQKVLTAFAVDMITREVRLSSVEQCDLIQSEAGREVIEQMRQDRGVVLLMCHGGFLSYCFSLINRAFKDTVYISGKADGARYASASEDRRAALFSGMRALMDKRVVLIAPDGKLGTKSDEMSIAGKPRSFGEGAAFLAYETRSATYWFGMQRKDEGFRPILLPGPVREPSETYADYRSRLKDFYAERLNDHFCGDPDNLVFLRGWFNVFDRP